MFFKDYKIILPLKVRETIQFWVDKADKEISGLGDAWIDEENKTITVNHAFLLKQECTAVETELDDEAIAKAMYDAHVDEGNGIRRNVKFWWHSHVNMSVYWSVTDKETMSKISEHGWFCNIVFNKKREMRGAMSYPVTKEAMGQVQTSVTYEDEIPIVVSSIFTQEELDNLENSFKENYSEKKEPVVRNLSYVKYNPGEVTESGRIFLWGNSWMNITQDQYSHDVMVEMIYRDHEYAYYQHAEDFQKHIYKDMPVEVLMMMYKEIEGISDIIEIANFVKQTIADKFDKSKSTKTIEDFDDYYEAEGFGNFAGFDFNKYDGVTDEDSKFN